MPERAITLLPLVALLLTVIEPVDLPAMAGLSVACMVADCPGARTVPVGRPAAAKPAPATLTLEMVTLALPVLVSVTFCTLLVETCTLPKLSAVVLAERTPLLAGAVVFGAAGAEAFWLAEVLSKKMPLTTALRAPVMFTLI